MAINRRALKRLLNSQGLDISTTERADKLVLLRWGLDRTKQRVGRPKVLGSIPRALLRHIEATAPHHAYAAKEILKHFNIDLNVSLPSLGEELNVELSDEYKAELIQSGTKPAALGLGVPGMGGGGIASRSPTAQPISDPALAADVAASAPEDLGFGDVSDEDFVADVKSVLGGAQQTSKEGEDLSPRPAPRAGDHVVFRDREGNEVSGEVKSGGTMAPGDVPGRQENAQRFFENHGGS